MHSSVRRQHTRAAAAILGALLLGGLLAGCDPQPFSVPSDTAGLPTIEPAMTQPPQRSEYQEFPAALYYPNRERTQLVCSIRTLRLVGGQTRADAVMYALLRRPGEEGLVPLFDRNVYARSVIVCRNLVTVNLSVDESDLAEEELVTACTAITASLTQISGVNYVRILFNGREMAGRGVLDNPMTLPAQPLYVLKAMHEMQDTGISAPMKSEEVLYFRDTSGRYLLTEVREIASTANPVIDILLELRKSPADAPGMMSAIPKTMVLEGHAFTPDENGTRTLTLRFSYPRYDTLDQQSLRMLLGSLVCSLCGRIEDLRGVQVYLNGVLQENIPGIGAVSGGILTPALFERLIGNTVTLYFRDAESSLLMPVTRAMAQDEFNLPESRIHALIEGPLAQESARAAAIFPEGVTGSDLLGVWIDESCMYVNFTQRFLNRYAAQQPDERTLVFGIVNTMAEMYGVRRVQILIEGKRVSTLAGLINIEAPLLPNPGFVSDTTTQSRIAG